MKIMKLKISLNQKLVYLTIFAFIIIIAFLEISEYLSSKKENMSHLRERVIQLSNVVQYGITSLMLQNQCDAVPLFLKKSSENIQSRISIFNPSTGAVLLTSHPSDGGNSLRDEDFDRYLTYNKSDPITITENHEQYMIRFLPIKNTDSCQRCHPSRSSLLGVIKIKHNLDYFLRDTRNNMIRHMIIAMIGITLFALIFSCAVMKLINDPLEKIMKTIHHVERGDLDSRVSIKRNDIIGELAEKINTMTEKRKEARIALEKYHTMQVMKASQMASIGEMAACIAHDIKNPLACMSSALQVIDGEMGDKDENKLIIKEVIDQIGRINQSVKNILQYAKPEPEHISEIDVDEILEHTLSLINKYASLKDVAVNLAKGAGEKKIQGGTQSLQQLFFNICLNGIEAMEAEGTLTIVSSLRDTGIAGKDGRWVEVDIRDTGCGINNHDMELIFNPLFTTKEKGTGLGLSISAKIVERYNGCIDVESIMGQGTNFKISFPAIAEG